MKTILFVLAVFLATFVPLRAEEKTEKPDSGDRAEKEVRTERRTERRKERRTERRKKGRDARNERKQRQVEGIREEARGVR